MLDRRLGRNRRHKACHAGPGRPTVVRHSDVTVTATEPWSMRSLGRRDGVTPQSPGRPLPRSTDKTRRALGSASRCSGLSGSVLCRRRCLPGPPGWRRRSAGGRADSDRGGVGPPRPRARRGARMRSTRAPGPRSANHCRLLSEMAPPASASLRSPRSPASPRDSQPAEPRRISVEPGVRDGRNGHSGRP